MHEDKENYSYDSKFLCIDGELIYSFIEYKYNGMSFWDRIDQDDLKMQQEDYSIIFDYSNNNKYYTPTEMENNNGGDDVNYLQLDA